jgi:hypothetical protein
MNRSATLVSIAFGILLCAGGALVAERAIAGGATPAARQVIAASTGNDSELVDTLPITRRAARKPRVVMSLGPSDLPTLRRGDRLEASAELQVSDTCVKAGPRCIGRRYSYSPFASARLILAAGEHVRGGRRAIPLTTRRSVHCGQRRPNRNHHCVLVFRHARRRIAHPRRLPCRPARCFLNLVAEAHHDGARAGNVMVVGADGPGGSVQQDKGRLNAVVARHRASATRRRTRRRVAHRLRVEAHGASPSRVAYSLRTSHLRAGDILVATAAQRTSIAGLAYNLFVSDHLILATRRGATNPTGPARRVGSLHGQLSEANGFNCTHGPSAYPSPCLTQKAGMIEIHHRPTRHGHGVPLYVNVVCHVLPKLAQPGPHDHARVLPGGYLEVRRLRAR